MLYRTPCAAGALQQLLHGGWIGSQWSREGLPKRLRWLVVDEADLLLSGGFAAATEQLLEVLPDCLPLSSSLVALQCATTCVRASDSVWTLPGLFSQGLFLICLLMLLPLGAVVTR